MHLLKFFSHTKDTHGHTILGHGVGHVVLEPSTTIKHYILVKEEDVKEERVRRASTSHHHQLQSLLPTLHQGEPFHHYELFL